LNGKNRNLQFIVCAAALAICCLAAFTDCQSKPAALTLSDLSGWIYVRPDTVAVGAPCTRYSFIYNNHLTDTAFVDSTIIDTLHYSMSFVVPPSDTVPAVEENDLTYPSAGTYVHMLTCYTKVGVLVCPRCTVTVQ
jgi:hypothetical protein